MSVELDGSFSIDDLKTAVTGFYKDRESMNAYNNEPMYTEMGLVLEASEVLEAAKFGLELGSELADVLIYLLALAVTHDVDLTSELLTKLATNETRFPPELFTGTADDFPRQYVERKLELGERK